MDSKTIVLDQEQISSRVRELGEQITREYAGRKVVMLCVLNGAFIFAADLCRAIDLELEIDFIRVASYGDAMHSSGTVQLIKSPELDLHRKDIILIEDIVDTGHTVAWLSRHFQESGANSVRLCTLIDKTERRETAVTIDFVGFIVNKGFLIGYGLDYAEQYRHLPAVFTLEKD